jgi:hypothetical protein
LAPFSSNYKVRIRHFNEQMKRDLKINDIGVGVNLLDEADAPADGFRLDFTLRGN